MDPLIVALVALAAFAVGAALGYAIINKLSNARIAAAITEGKATLSAERLHIVGELERQSQEQLKKQREALESAVARDRVLAANERDLAKKERAQVADIEERTGRREAKLSERERTLETKIDSADRREAKVRERDESFERREQEFAGRILTLDAREKDIDQRLSTVAGMTPDQARDELLKRMDTQLASEQAERIGRMEKDLNTRAKELGTEIIGRAIQRYAAEHTADTTITKIKLADEEMKGRIIGKEGRNIKSFEQATGVDLVIDETPGVITISCFSGLRREMARRTLEVLLQDGRIHPGRIEEVMAKVQQDMDREVMKLGEDAAFACEVSGLHPQLLKLLGKLRYRTSYGQNVLQHTQEVAFLCGAMASDLGLDPKLGRRCGLMHDIGKAIDHEQEGSHPELGYEALKRFGESEIVANAALAHHEGHAVLSTYTVLAAAADAISAARPGARSKNIEGYIKRLQQIEDIALSYTGVQKAYAIQAGRELRVILNGREIPEGEMPKLAHDIARRIEGEVAYPGEVKVTLIRELRQSAVAR